MAWLGAYLLLKQEDQSLDSQEPCEELGVSDAPVITLMVS